jgi:hypothetical protein
MGCELCITYMDIKEGIEAQIYVVEPQVGVIVFFSSRHYRPNKACRTAGIVVSGGKIYSCGVGRKLRFYVNIFFCQTKNNLLLYVKYLQVNTIYFFFL